MAKYKTDDVIHDSKHNIHFVLEAELPSINCFCIEVLTKGNRFYGKNFTVIDLESLELERFTLIGRNAVIK